MYIATDKASIICVPYDDTKNTGRTALRDSPYHESHLMALTFI